MRRQLVRIFYKFKPRGTVEMQCLEAIKKANRIEESRKGGRK